MGDMAPVRVYRYYCAHGCEFDYQPGVGRWRLIHAKGVCDCRRPTEMREVAWYISDSSGNIGS